MASSLTAELSPSEREYILDGCADNCRNDGRSRDDFRNYTIIASSEPGEGSSDWGQPLILSNGSARLFLSASGNAATHVLCSVKAELGHPSKDNPYQGSIQIHVEDSLSGTSSSTRRKSEEDRNYLQSILSDLLTPNLLDLESLCILPFHYAFTVNIDLEVLSGTAGSLIDALSHTIRAALQNTLLPRIMPSSTASSTSVAREPTGSTSADLLLDSDISQAKVPSGIDHAPVVITVTVCHGPMSNPFLLLLDATLEEETCSFCQVHVAVIQGDATSEPTICALRKSGNGSLPWAILPDISALAIKAVSSARASYKTAISGSQQQGLLQEQFTIQ